MIKILIVEDQNILQVTTREILEPLGMEVFSALTQEQARAMFPLRQWDLIFMDACVPGGRINTVDLVKEFRQTYSGPMVASSGDPSFNERLREAGCDYECAKSMVGFAMDFFNIKF